MHVPNPLQSAAIARPDRAALIADDAALSAAELAHRAAIGAARLHAMGLRAGDVVALAGDPSAAWVIAFHALGWLGATAAVISPTALAVEVQTLLAVVAPKAVIAVGDSTAATEIRTAAAATADAAAAGFVSPVIIIEGGALVGDAPVGGTSAEEAEGTTAAAEAKVQAGWPERPWPLDEVRVIVPTSGSTGEPKAVSLTTAQIMFNVFGAMIRVGHDLDDRWLCCLPLHHVGGLMILFRAAWMGTTVVLHRRFDAERVADAVDFQRITLVSLVPTMLDRLLRIRRDRPFSSALRAILVGGAPMPTELLGRCRAIGAPIALTWGMTETASQIATGFAGDNNGAGNDGAESAGESVFPILPATAFARIEAVDGRLVVSGPIAPHARFVTADAGVVDARGWVQITGRADDALISGGETIVPAEIERVLSAHPAVAEVVVVGVPDIAWGESAVAVMVRRAEVSMVPSEAELREWCRDRLAPVKTPKKFLWRDDLPRTALGKPARHALLRELAPAPSAGGGVGRNQP